LAKDAGKYVGCKLVSKPLLAKQVLEVLAYAQAGLISFSKFVNFGATKSIGGCLYI